MMTQMTNQKKTELIDFFDPVWIGLKIQNFWKIFWKWKPFFPKQLSKSYFGDLHYAQKNSENSPTFSSKIPERVDIGTL